jgi:hypothetical protein
MTTLTRSAMAIILWSTVSASTYAQNVANAADIRAQLRSASPSQVAWAAFDAGTYQLHEAVPELIAVLESPPPAADREQQYIVAAVLDALVQIRGIPSGLLPPPAVPASILSRYYTRWPVQTLILLGRAGPERDPILRNLLRTASGYRWYAIANCSCRDPNQDLLQTCSRD